MTQRTHEELLMEACAAMTSVLSLRRWPGRPGAFVRDEIGFSDFVAFMRATARATRTSTTSRRAGRAACRAGS